MKRNLLICALLVSANAIAGEPDRIANAVEKSVALLGKSGVQFFKSTGCISCHNQSLPSMAFAMARERGFKVDEQAAVHSVKATIGLASTHRETMLQAVSTIPASTIVSTYAMIGLAAEGYEGDMTTDALVHELAARQRRDGRWTLQDVGGNPRPPLDQGDITTTTLTLRSLQLYGMPGRKHEFAARVAKAREWMMVQTPVTTQEAAMQVLGLTWSDAAPARIRQAADQLLAMQREDGGWSQLPMLESDSYATGQALVALWRAGLLTTTDAAYQHGVEYLLGTQADDGSWHVKSRSLGFQPYMETGYPHQHDQWISSAGAAWATMALAVTREPAEVLARF